MLSASINLHGLCTSIHYVVRCLCLVTAHLFRARLHGVSSSRALTHDIELNEWLLLPVGSCKLTFHHLQSNSNWIYLMFLLFKSQLAVKWSIAMLYGHT